MHIVCQYLYIQHTTNIQEKSKLLFLLCPKYSYKQTKTDPFTDNYHQHLKYPMLCTDLCKCMAFKVVQHLNNIG